MGKGSQLSQLKSAISQAGLTRQQQPSKKRKRSRIDQADKDKKASKLKQIHEKLNPFDLKVTKLKHDVGGRKIKGVTGRPAQSKQAGIEERKKTLLKEYVEKHHSGGIVDRRFGENDLTMTPEERMLERFTRERQRASKGTAFNLEEEEELTHYGQSLSNLDDFDNVGLGFEDEDEEETRGQIDSETVQRAHFGGFDEDEPEEGEDDEPPRKKSKAEVMAEVIAKSKEHKYLRQAEKEETENLRHQLDQEFDSIRSLLFTSAPKEGQEQEEDEAATLLESQDKGAEYDQFVRELAFEKRAKPKDRTKTEEELALEEKERLEKAERRRLRRMRGEEDAESSDKEGGKGKHERERGGDDLVDDFYDDGGDFSPLGAGLQEDGVNMSGEESGDEVDGDMVSGSEEGEEDEEEGEDGFESEDDEDEDQSEGAEGKHEDLVQPRSHLAKAGKKWKEKAKTGSLNEFPYIFPAPNDHEDFLEIVEDIEDKDIPTVVQRIRTLHHPSLAEDNKVKLQTLTTVLIDHILSITSPPTPRFSLLSSLLPHIFSLTKSYPTQSAQHFVDKLHLMQKNLKRGLSRGALRPDSKTWPGLPELSFLRITGVIWPTSDMKHPVISPARLLMASYLGLARVRSLEDLASGLFVCTLFLQYEKLSKRLVPEVVNFTTNGVLHLFPSLPQEWTSASDLPGHFPSPDFRSLSLSIDPKKANIAAVATPDLVALLSGDSQDDQAKVDLLALSLELLGRFADMYKGLEGFIELYDPILRLIQRLEIKKLLDDLKTRVTSLIDKLRRLLKFARQSRQPLQLQAHKPIPIPSYIPKFESSSSNYLRARDPDHERDQAVKLRKQYKQEKKGALRELRKDARFLAGVQQKEQMEKDKQYGERMRKVFGGIEGERAEQKKMEREKAKEKRRAGRK